MAGWSLAQFPGLEKYELTGMIFFCLLFFELSVYQSEVSKTRVLVHP